MVFKCLKFNCLSESHLVGLDILSKFVQNLTMAVVCDMFHSILVNGAQPKIVALAVGFKDIHCYIWTAHLFF